MEPLNCTVRIENGKCDVWVGCQSPGVAQGLAARITGLSKDDVTVHSTFLGGGFGRRVYSDYVAEATAIARESGLAVQLIWSREDDTRHDYYRPASLAGTTNLEPRRRHPSRLLSPGLVGRFQSGPG